MTEALVAAKPEFARLLLEIDQYTIRVENVLSGMSRRISLFTLFASTRHILTFLEHEYSSGEPTSEAAARRRDEELRKNEAKVLNAHRQNLRAFKAYYAQAAARQAQIVYLGGMLTGFVGLSLVIVGLGFLFTYIDVPGVTLDSFLACVIAGGIGSVISVLLRMSSDKFHVNAEIGREFLWRLGAFRPAIGATFALFVYFALKGGLLPQITVPDDGTPEGFAWFLAIGFLVGFSERLAKEMVRDTSAALTSPPATGGGGEGAASELFPSIDTPVAQHDQRGDHPM